MNELMIKKIEENESLFIGAKQEGLSPFEERKRLHKLMTGDADYSISDVINKNIVLKEFFIFPEETMVDVDLETGEVIIDDETGEPKVSKYRKAILTLANGKTVFSRSSSIVKALIELGGIFNDPEFWKNGIPITIVKNTTKLGYTWYKINIIEE